MSLKNYRPGKTVTETAMDQILHRNSEQHGKEFCIDVGAGEAKSPNFQTVDINPKFGTDMVGDIRYSFVPSLVNEVSKYPDLLKITDNSHMVVRMTHIIEHIEWIYQEEMFKWVYRILAPGGFAWIATPNLEYAVGVYILNRKRQLRQKKASYPIHEHMYLREGVDADMQRWVNFKIFSGCSPGDYHHTMYDRFWLVDLLKATGFEKISIYDGPVLKAVAYKPGDKTPSIDEAIRRTVQ